MRHPPNPHRRNTHLDEVLVPCSHLDHAAEDDVVEEHRLVAGSAWFDDIVVRLGRRRARVDPRAEPPEVGALPSLRDVERRLPARTRQFFCSSEEWRGRTRMMLQSDQSTSLQRADWPWLSPTVHARTVPCQRRLLFPPGTFLLRSIASLYRENSSVWSRLQ